MKRKISECINVRINVGNYQHIELVRYAEQEVEYDSDAQRIALEDQLTSDLTASVIRSMRSIPAKLGKGIENAQQVEEAIQKAIPAWLEKGPVPNIANQAKIVAEKVAAEQKDNAASTSRIIAEDKPVATKSADKPATPVPPASTVVPPPAKPTATKPPVVDDLFDD